MGGRQWKIAGCVVDLSRYGLIMGVLNVTPDSFSDAGRFFSARKAVERGLSLAQEGAQIIDVGGESTRPGAESVAAEEGLRRVVPVIKELRASIDILISIDTSKAQVARAAIEAGASIVNDVTGGQGDKEMIPLVAESKAAFIIMHMQGNPRTMQIAPHYIDVVSEVADFFRQQYARALECGIDPMAIAFDPGIGFGKTLEHNLELLAQLERIRVHERPLVFGVSRKSFLAKLTGSSEINDRVAPAAALTSLLRTRGADVFRVHDVKENVNALQVDNSLGLYEETGVTIDGDFSVELVLAIFHPKGALHDGGVIVRNSRIAAAACIFPVSQRETLDRSLGLRHRAGLGITEESDAVAVIVSEETGSISICHRRRIERNFTPETFRQRIAEILLHGNYEETDPEKLAREVNLPPARDNPLVPDQKERSDDRLAL